MRCGVLMVLAAVAAIGVFAGGLGWLLPAARPPAGAPRAQRLYYAYCAECHGVDGRGSWRASVFLLRPSDLTDPRVAAQSDRYLFDIIKHGGATIGRPGMPAFGAQLSDEDIQLLLGYVRTLALRRTGAQRQAHAPVDLGGRTGPAGAARPPGGPGLRARPATPRRR